MKGGGKWRERGEGEGPVVVVVCCDATALVEFDSNFSEINLFGRARESGSQA